jgi:2-iminoacetate synthase
MLVKDWIKQAIKPEENEKYLQNGNDFINDDELQSALEKNVSASKEEIRAIIAKSKSIQALSIDETAKLLHVKDPELWNEINTAALEIKKKVYDNRIVFFAPMYCSNLCVNNCSYCGFRSENKNEVRRVLTQSEVVKETESVLDNGHKRMIMVYGEHPKSNIDYMVETIKSVYSVERKAPVSGRVTSIRRVNIYAAPMSVGDLK